jgi:hypothetical protein
MNALSPFFERRRPDLASFSAILAAAVLAAPATPPAPPAPADATKPEYWVSAVSADTVYVVDVASIEDTAPHARSAWVYSLLKTYKVLYVVPVAIISDHYVVDCEAKTSRDLEKKVFDDRMGFIDSETFDKPPTVANPGTVFALNVQTICQYPQKPADKNRISQGASLAQLAAHVRIDYGKPGT